MIREEKPCPGLYGIYCGVEKLSGQGYCDDHRRQYQRDRYSARKRAAELGRLTTRAYRRGVSADIELEEGRCPSCSCYKPDELVQLTNFPSIPAICKLCVKVYDKIRNELPAAGNFIALAEFLLKHKDVVLQDDDGDMAFSNEVRRRVRTKQLEEGWDSYGDAEEAHAARIAEEIRRDLDKGTYYYDDASNAILRKTNEQIRSEIAHRQELRRQELLAKETPEQREARLKEEQEMAEAIAALNKGILPNQ